MVSAELIQVALISVGLSAFDVVAIALIRKELDWRSVSEPYRVGLIFACLALGALGLVVPFAAFGTIGVVAAIPAMGAGILCAVLLLLFQRFTDGLWRRSTTNAVARRERRDVVSRSRFLSWLRKRINA